MPDLRRAPLALLVASVAVIVFLRSARADAESWRYCLAPDHADNKVYISEVFRSDTGLSEAQVDFDTRLNRSGLAHDDVQCPGAESERSASLMRRHAIRFNEEYGASVVPVRDARTK